MCTPPEFHNFLLIPAKFLLHSLRLHLTAPVLFVKLQKLFHLFPFRQKTFLLIPTLLIPFSFVTIDMIIILYIRKRGKLIMKILFYRYGSICEPDIMEAMEHLGHEVSSINLEITNKNIPA